MTEWIVAGLGNPGAAYVGTRHNVGAEVIQLLANEHGGRLKTSAKEHALVDTIRIHGQRVVLAFPQTFMNESGRSLGALARRDGFAPERLIVVHDELDLPVGALRVKFGGGLAGHNGLRSIKAHLGTADFVRVRIGVDKPPSKERGVSHVLNRIPKHLREEFDILIGEAADAVESVIADGVEAAQQRFNR
ncbi:MAG TPA: aminoacyl-tRNA hydrolase [Acidimicrobiales bacterium]|jgi:PTH1 family peptidyl-tRNA hydrolase